MESAANGGSVVPTAIAAVVPTAVAATISVATPVAIADSAAIAVAATVAIAIPAAVTIVAATVPGAGTNKESAAKPRRAVVTVRCTGIRVVAVVSVSADGSSIAVATVNGATNAHPDRHLGMGVGCRRNDQDSE
jgi:hypothetical protein